MPGGSTTRVRDVALFTLGLALYAWACVAHARATSFLPVRNDFWGNAFAADHWQWSARRMWNGFFPPGYPFLLTVLPGSRLIESAFLFNVVAGAALLIVVWTWVQRHAGPWPAHLAAALVAVHPLLLTQVLTTGPDAACVTLGALGALLLFSAVDGAPRTIGTAVAAGMALAAAALLRYHAFPFSAALLAAAAIVGGRGTARVVVAAAIPIAIAGLALAAIGLAAGDLLAVLREQAFTVFTRLVEPSDPVHLPPPAGVPQTVGDAIARDPNAFRRNYLAFSAPHLWYLIPPMAAVFFASGAARRFGVFTLLAGLLFVPVVNLGASPRGIAGLLPLILVTFAWTAIAGLARVRSVAVRRVVVAAVAVIGLAHAWQVWWPEVSGFVSAARARSQSAATLEAALRADGVASGSQVFATTEAYLLGASGWQIDNVHPRIIASRPAIDLDGYLEAYPPPSIASLDALLDDCRRAGVTHLVLGDGSSRIQPELGELFDGRRSSPRVTEVAGAPGVRVFRIVG
jgi:hypothetical protein